MLTIHLLPALYGDSFYIESMDEDFNFLIDCGYKVTYYQKIKKLIKKTDFLILTHVDEDHILGAIPLVEDYPENFFLNKIYFNSPNSIKVNSSSGNISIGQAINLESLLISKKIPYFSLVQGDKLPLSKKCNLTVISPSNDDLDYFNKKYETERSSKKNTNLIGVEDKELEEFEKLAIKKNSYKSKKSDFVNASSIAFILEYEDKKVLFLGDAHPEVITEYLTSEGYSQSKKIFFDYVKLSHHGSIKSISNEFISMITCSSYIVSTIGGKVGKEHPSRETIAKIALNGCRGSDEYLTFHFNYDLKEYNRAIAMATSEELNKHKIIFSHSKTLKL